MSRVAGVAGWRVAHSHLRGGLPELAATACMSRFAGLQDGVLPIRVVTFQNWLRTILFQLLRDVSLLDESSEEVWSAALGCLMQSITRNGVFMRPALQGLSTTVVARLLQQAHDHAWCAPQQTACAVVDARDRS